MSISTIQMGGQNVTLVDVPTFPVFDSRTGSTKQVHRFRTVQFDYDVPAAVVQSGYGSQVQVQPWPGAETLSGTFSLPPLTQADADQWLSFFMLLNGQANAFLIGDPMKANPRGRVDSRSTPVVTTSDPTTQNLPGSNQLVTRGWVGAGRQLEPGDNIQIGYRMYRVLLPVISADGNATLTIAPSLREQPADGTPIILNHPRMLVRLAQSKTTWNADFTKLTTLSFQFTEWRGPASA